MAKSSSPGPYSINTCAALRQNRLHLRPHAGPGPLCKSAQASRGPVSKAEPVGPGPGPVFKSDTAPSAAAFGTLSGERNAQVM